MFARDGESPGNRKLYQYKEDNHDKYQQDVVRTNLQALFVGGRRMRKWRSNNARHGSDPACSGSQNLTKSSQLPGIAKGRPDVQQLQTFRSSKFVPDR
jgi:hypothetical protein